MKSAKDVYPAKAHSAKQRSDAEAQLCRMRKKMAKETAEASPLVVPSLVIGISSVVHSQEKNKKKAAGVAKTRTRALARAHKTIKCLEDEMASVKRKLKTKNKQLERL